jgi:DNA polymerase-3 subunit alpha
LVKFCLDNGIKQIAITDNHNLFGAVEFSLKCGKHGIKAIIGVKVRIEGNRSLLIYAKNKIGYENISYLLSYSYTRNKNHEVTWSKLFTKVEGVMVIAVPSMLAANNEEDLRTCGEHLKYCGAEWYVGLELGVFEKATSYLSEIFDKHVIAISQAQFLYSQNQEAHDTLLCIKNKTYISDLNREKSDSSLQMLTEEMARDRFANFDFAIANTWQFANRCNFCLEESSYKLPRFLTQGSENTHLRNLAFQGLAKMNLDPTKYELYKNRLEYELSIISKKIIFANDCGNDCNIFFSKFVHYC